ncbi:hypothetical protein ABZ345_36320 [Lentzea sp. NPDC005914]|uniref:hypothetical protein n=1 Tax=Lentzea sp. NPDC005914 TaxID=3154572 RepID=UPI0033C5B40A
MLLGEVWIHGQLGDRSRARCLLHADAGKPVEPATEAWLRQITTDLPEAMPTRLWYSAPFCGLSDRIPVAST